MCSPESPESERSSEDLRGAQASRRVVRGAAIRTAGYAVGTLANVGASIVLLRYLGVEQFGAYVAVMSVVSIAGGVSDGGISAVGNRELALLASDRDRRDLMAKLLGMRLVITPLAVLLAVSFTVASGYPSKLIAGTLVAGVGWILVATSSSLAMPLSVELKIASLTALEVVKQLGFTIVIVLLVVAHAPLVALFAATLPGALAALILTPVLAGRQVVGLPSFQLSTWGDLLRSALPMALAAVLSVVYLKCLTILMFQLTNDRETGLFGTSARIVETIGGLPLLGFMVAIPVLSVSNADGRARLRGMLQNMVEVGMVLSGLLVTGLFVGAPIVIQIVGGDAYAEAVPVLRVQCFALVGSLLAMACLMAAIAMDMRRVIVTSNTIGLSSVVVLGIPMILLWGARGAAVATVVGDLVMALAFWLLIGREDRSIRPRLVPFWKTAAGVALGIGIPLLVGGGDVVRTACGVVSFAVVIVVTSALPRELLHAMRRR